MEIVRVFPRYTSQTPRDPLAFVGDPPLFRPPADEVHVSVAFSWDMAEAERLREAWACYYPVVRLGGPAVGGDVAGEFTPGLYVKPGVTFTSRGCIRRCPWCVVPEREGMLRCLDVKDGWMVQDNNVLATPRDHQRRVYGMLGEQSKAVVFSGGLDARLFDEWVAHEMARLRVRAAFFAADTDGLLRELKRVRDLTPYWGRRQRRCYVMLGYDGETMEEARRRLEAVWDLGFMPFAQLYQPGGDARVRWPVRWREIERLWARPAAMIAAHGGVV